MSVYCLRSQVQQSWKEQYAMRLAGYQTADWNWLWKAVVRVQFSGAFQSLDDCLDLIQHTRVYYKTFRLICGYSFRRHFQCKVYMYTNGVSVSLWISRMKMFWKKQPKAISRTENKSTIKCGLHPLEKKFELWYLHSVVQRSNQAECVTIEWSALPFLNREASKLAVIHFFITVPLLRFQNSKL